LIKRDIHISVVSHKQLNLVKNLFHDFNSLNSKARFQITLTLNIAEKESIDLSEFLFPIKLIQNEITKGFGENHNQAFLQPPDLNDRHYFFVINPDVRINQDIFSVLVGDLAHNENIGVIAPLVRNYQGKIEDSCRDIPTPWRIIKKFFGLREINQCLTKGIRFQSDWAAGMFLGFRSDIFKLLKGFDEDYFLYYEDVDICSRVWLEKLIVLVNPDVAIIHNGQRESHRNLQYLYWHLHSMFRFFLSAPYRQTRNRMFKSYQTVANDKLQWVETAHISLPIISLITVSFNRQETIEDTILSVKSQNFKHIEYLIIDGASTDNTLTIIKQYPDVVDYYVSESDKGIYDAMNKGISMATGDIIGFINADDILASPTVLENVAYAFATQKIDACYADLVYVDQMDLNKVRRYWHSSLFKVGAFAKGWSPPHPTFYVKKSIYQQFGFFSLDYQLGNDIELMLRFLEKVKIRTCYIPQLWVKMRMGGVSNQSITNILLQNKEIIRAAKDNQIPFFVPIFILFKLTSRFAQYFFK
jgi:GT2 family glycosyltransferase